MPRVFYTGDENDEEEETSRTMGWSHPPLRMARGELADCPGDEALAPPPSVEAAGGGADGSPWRRRAPFRYRGVPAARGLDTVACIVVAQDVAKDGL